MILPPQHLVTIDGITTTSRERTLVDLTGSLTFSALARCLDAGLVADQVEVERLRAMVEELRPAPGRRRKALRVLLDERGPESERTDSTKEIRMLAPLRAAGLPMPEPQYKVNVAGRRYRFDAAYPDQRVGLEYLGWDPHRTRTAFDADHQRDRLLTLEGWTIVYFTSASTDAEVVRTVERLLTEPRPFGSQVAHTATWLPNVDVRSGSEAVRRAGR